MTEYKPFTLAVIEIVKSIPVGYISTYGDIAKYAGNPRGALSVVRVLSSLSRKFDLPWHRVINSRGVIALNSEDGFSIQKQLLLDEGIEVDEGGGIDLKRYRFEL